jgi:hypothetical protein
MKFFAVIFLAMFSLSLPATANESRVNSETNQPALKIQRAEKIRESCLAGRRLICGRIIRVLPDGLVVESGYTDLLHPPLNNSWLISGNVTVRRPDNMIENIRPESACIGTVFLTDLPRARGVVARPKQYDYVALLGYPTGQHTYASVGTVKKTVRQFSGNLLKAVRLNAEAEKPDAVK